MTCEAQFAEGSKVTLSATPAAGSVFAGWSGACSGAIECEVTMTEAKTVKAEFNLIGGSTLPLSVKKTGAGTGTVTSSPPGIDCGATCSAEFFEGAEVTLTETPETGSSFAGWSGGCSGTGPCTVTMTEALEVEAEFGEVTTVPLTVAKSGEGAVVSTPAGIDCGTGCFAETAELEPGKVQLAETPASGYEFAGWIGCKSTGAATCEVDLISSTEVTAVFLKEGKEGKEGADGTNGGTGPQGPAGTPGATGTAGATGPAGPAGATGPIGPTGQRGEPGNAGTVGAVGPTGPQGPVGAAGKVQLVKCTTIKKGHKKVQKCTTQLISGTVKFKTTSAAHATLSRHGVVLASGIASSKHGHLELQLEQLHKLRPGRYMLTLISGAGKHKRIQREQFTLS